ncbi:3-deoxy-D-manno-octulosonic acid transferase [Yoonia maritima]|uniref:3-deoxy-D-manno-octulosonic acid transferase n=1 Tax=Yoonia maritima TaxID=1435347 RepID=UPI0037353D32
MARSLSIAAYLASRGSADQPTRILEYPARPEGVVIWARCTHPDQLTAIETLGRKVTVDGDPITIIPTLRDWTHEIGRRAVQEPRSKEAIREFIAHWQPTLGIWVRGDLDPLLMDEMRAANMRSILVDANGDGLEQTTGGWVPGAMRSLLSQFEAILALDKNAADRLIRAGAPSDAIIVSGAMEDCPPPLPCDEEERQTLANAIGTRPTWLAAAAHLAELNDLSRAHQQASRRAHRLLFIMIPRNKNDATAFAETMREKGFYVTLRSEEPTPTELTQVYIIDTDDDLGLWYRIAPITFIGGTLRGGGCRDPFEATALGSAVLYGPLVAPFQRHAARLNAASASRLIRSSSDLGAIIEILLAVDKTAELAHAAWDVTSRGATVSNRIADYIRLRLEELGY